MYIFYIVLFVFRIFQSGYSFKLDLFIWGFLEDYMYSNVVFCPGFIMVINFFIFLNLKVLKCVESGFPYFAGAQAVRV